MQEWSEAEVFQILDQVSQRPSGEIESEMVEFKAHQNENALHNSKELAEEISAFANKNGGIVIVGVRDSSSIPDRDWKSQLVGFEFVDELHLKERLSGKIRPVLNIVIRNLQFRGLNFVLIIVPRRRDTLVSTSSGKYYIRDGRSSRPMSPQEIEDAVKALATYDWSGDLVPLNIHEVLDKLAMSEAKTDFIARRGIREELNDAAFLEAINVTRDGVLTKGGLLFLGETNAIRVNLGEYEFRFSSKKKPGKLDINDVWSGCLWHAIKRGKHYFNTCNNVQSFIYKEASGVSKQFSAPLLDETAFHEAYLNAMVHRDYAIDGMVSVNFIGNKLTISSPGRFYGGITADNILLHEPRHRNKTLARILMSHNLVDRAGIGVPRMGLGRMGSSLDLIHLRGD